MCEFGDLFQSDDWKNEKHVPVIECPEVVEKGKIFEVKVSIGKEIAHPNTVEHHIRWIQLHFQPEGSKVSYQIGNFEFTAHGEGGEEGVVYTHHGVTAQFKVNKPGKLFATSLCNIHGLWENTKEIKLK